jgi:hypothetical protein
LKNRTKVGKDTFVKRQNTSTFRGIL